MRMGKYLASEGENIYKYSNFHASMPLDQWSTKIYLSKNSSSLVFGVVVLL